MADAEKIYLHIERLILDQALIERGQGPLLQAAVEAELTRLLAADGLGARWMGGGAVPGVPRGEVHVQDGEGPSGLGAQIAQAIYQGIGR